MASPLRGTHHCVGLANSVADMVFRVLQNRCAAGGGNISAADLVAARAQVSTTIAGSYSFFDKNHQRCNAASASTAPDYFQQDTILGALLSLCGQKPVRSAFTTQINRFGPIWLDQFFGGLADFVRKNVSATADERLMKIYAALAIKLGWNMSLEALFKEDATLQILRECTMPFLIPNAAAALAAPVSDVVSDFIAAKRNIPKPDLSKVTEQEMKNFLTYLPPQLQLVIPRLAQPPKAATA